MEGEVKLVFDEKRKLVDFDKRHLAQIFDKFKIFTLAPLYMEGHEGALFRKLVSFTDRCIQAYVQSNNESS